MKIRRTQGRPRAIVGCGIISTHGGRGLHEAEDPRVYEVLDEHIPPPMGSVWPADDVVHERLCGHRGRVMTGPSLGEGLLRWSFRQFRQVVGELARSMPPEKLVQPATRLVTLGRQSDLRSDER